MNIFLKQAIQQVDGKYLLDRKDGNKTENKSKNRFKAILPCKI